MHVVCFFVA